MAVKIPSTRSIQYFAASHTGGNAAKLAAQAATYSRTYEAHAIFEPWHEYLYTVHERLIQYFTIVVNWRHAPLPTLQTQPNWLNILAARAASYFTNSGTSP